MLNEERLKIYDELIEAGKKIMLSKGKEYANSTDCLANFKRCARFMGITPEQYVLTMASKQYDWLRQFAETGEANIEPPEEKVVDVINYLVNYICLVRSKN